MRRLLKQEVEEYVDKLREKVVQDGNKTVIGGNLDVDGSITGDEIVEKMEGYSFVKSTNEEIDIIYAGIVKNGNKLTMVLFGAITPASNKSVDTMIELGTFNLIEEIKAKIIWYTSGSLSYVTAEGKVPLTYSVANSLDGQFYFRADSQGNEVVRLYNKGQLNVGTTYHFRIEQTFLLSDNLAV